MRRTGRHLPGWQLTEHCCCGWRAIWQRAPLAKPRVLGGKGDLNGEGGPAGLAPLLRVHAAERYVGLALALGTFGGSVCPDAHQVGRGAPEPLARSLALTDVG